MLADLTAATFSPYLGSTFHLPETGIDLVLTGVEERGGPRSDGLRAPFSLVFTGPVETALDQRIHAMEHPELGALEVFLVPIGPDRYEAVFG